MERTLGLHFSGPDGEHFFRSSLVQTLFYGLFSGWMLWRQRPHVPGSFDWKDASEHLALPLIGDLYEEIARPRRLADLHLREPIEWAAASLNSVDEAEFFKSFDADHAITLFYEPFLQSFDPELRKDLGVWYTPHEIVRYMVGRVDELLKSELGIANGLADESVYVLDPAVGTGSYVIEVARRIHQTLTEQGHGALAAGEVKKALTTRVFGFEILAAPYVVAHLQLGVTLREMGTRFAPGERGGIYLTNALTGWEPPKGAKQTIAFPFLEDEQREARKVKHHAPIIVILGNPPYNGFAGVALDEERDLMQPYYEGLEEFDVNIRALNDLYVRFFRLAERRIGEASSRGIVSFISNYSWLDGQSHPVMRKRLLEGFEKIFIDNCNGDKYRTGKRTPDGRPDQSMFTTDAQPIGIQVGTAIATMVNRVNAPGGKQPAEVFYRDLWGTANEKRNMLIASTAGFDEVPPYISIIPSQILRFSFTPGTTASSYEDWIPLDELFERSYPGVKTSRDDLVVDIDRDELVGRMRRYFDPAVSNEAIKAEASCAMASTNRYDALETRRVLLREGFDPGNIRRFAYRPFDDRWVYWQPTGKLLDEKRSEYIPQVWPDNIALIRTAAIRKSNVGGPSVITEIGCLDIADRAASVFPALRKLETGIRGNVVVPNVAIPVLERIAELRHVAIYASDGHSFTEDASNLSKDAFLHTLAVLWSPAYREENEAALRQDWPRVPVPAEAALLKASSALGQQVADLLLPDKPVEGVTVGKLRPELRNLAVPTKVGGGVIQEPDDTIVTAGWGFRGQKNAVMAGKGRVLPHAGSDDAFDIYINDSIFWSNVPADVWAMSIGGYPVVKKWLSYREHKVLGRALRTEELAYVTQVVRRLKALLLLGPALDANYRAAAAAPQVNLTSKSGTST
jgi:predicted helicase